MISTANVTEPDLAHKVVRVIEPILHSDLNLSFLPLGFLGCLRECVRLELPVLEELVFCADIDEDVQVALGRLTSREEVARVVCEPLDRRKRARRRVDVV